MKQNTEKEEENNKILKIQQDMIDELREQLENLKDDTTLAKAGSQD